MKSLYFLLLENKQVKLEFWTVFIKRFAIFHSNKHIFLYVVNILVKNIKILLYNHISNC